MLSRSGRRRRTIPRLRSIIWCHSKWILTAIIAGVLVQDPAKDNPEPQLRVEAPPAAITRPEEHQSTLQPARWPNDKLTIANLGHSTLLMNFFGVRVISDPSLFERVEVRLG